MERPKGMGYRIRSVASVALVVAVATGAWTAVPASADTNDSAVVGWGSDFFGELGDGTTQDTSVPVRALGIADSVRQIAAGSAHSLALTTRGEVWAWGDNTTGELGDGTTTAHHLPQRVPGLTGVVAIAAGNGFSLAVLADGTVKAWGQNNFGQLGIPHGPNQLVPLTVPGLSGAVSVAAGGEHSLALRNDGSVWGWGFDGDGELGDGGTSDRPTPAPVLHLAGVRQIVAEQAGSAALLADGTVWTWGTGSEGELGNGLRPRFQTTPVQALVSGIVTIAGGDLHTLAVRADGTVLAWGFNLDREVANDPEINQPTPRPVAGLPGGITQVAGGHTSSLALDAHGNAWAWGRVSGNPTVNAPMPFQVPGLTGASAIAASGDHYHALIDAPSFTISLNPTSGSTPAGATATTEVTLAPANGYAGSATLSVSGLPAGVTASFSPGQVSAGSPATLTLHTAVSSPTGTFPITVTATDTSALDAVKTATYELTITPLASFTIALSSTEGSIIAGGTVTTQVRLTPVNGFNGSATLSVAGLPDGMTSSFMPATVSAGSPATVTLTTEQSPSGDYQVEITATAVNGAASPPSQTIIYELTISGQADPGGN